MYNVHIIAYEFLVITGKSEKMSNFLYISWVFQFHKYLNFVHKWKDGSSSN